jgi:Polyketide cyclase / dehydrase and lipid transport
VSLCRRQGFIDAPLDVVWDLISDIEHHPQWWPRVIEVHCEGLDQGCTYRQLTQTPLGEDEMNLLIEHREELRSLRIRCLNTGTFIRFELTGARGGTFVDGEMGMDPQGIKARVIDATAGRRYFSDWIAKTLEALDQAANRHADA